MTFLRNLAEQLNNQFSLGENTSHTLDNVTAGQNSKYGSLGAFADKIDQSAQRKYLEEGYLRTDPYNMNLKQFEVLMQEPNATVLIKKRMFSSIAENFRPDFMDQDEKLYYKTMKILFQNKCKMIAAIEKLSKIERITSALGSISDQLLPIITTLSDVISSNNIDNSDSLFNSAAEKASVSNNTDVGNLSKVVDKIRRLSGFNTTSKYTSWITDVNNNSFTSQLGEGTGVIEITNFTNLNTNVSVDGIKAPGSFGLSISDPYNMMLITELDIEKAISDATNMYYNHGVFQFGKQNLEQSINDAQIRLNQLRSTRGVSSISFSISPNTLLGKRVTAIIDRIGLELIFDYNPGLGGIGNTITVNEDYLRGGALAGNDGLNDHSASSFDNNGRLISETELVIFKSLVSFIYDKIQLDASSRNAFQLNNKNTNYTRKKLRFNFLGRLIIQPMDVVHIYINSKSTYDDKLFSGLQNMFNGGNTLQNINNNVSNLTQVVNTLFNPAQNINLQLEKSTFVGPDFPNYLWLMLRDQFVSEKQGTHVFTGVVENPDDMWSDGKFTVDIRGRDNTVYFDQGKVNFKPGVDAFNGAIFDPLTPFKSNFDTITSNAKDETPQLLDENIAILGTSQDKKGLLKAKAGPLAGQKITADTFLQGTLISETGQLSREIFAPDGLVYKWKEGIGVFVQFGNSLELNNPNRVGAPNIAKEPFAGQDVMNVLSLLVTGQPYNYANYWKASQNIDGIGKDPQSQQDSAYSYTASLKNDLIKNNLLWGNFIPFKNLVIDEQSFALAMQSQFRIIQKNKDLDNKIQKLSDLNQQAAIFGAANAFSDANDFFNPQFLEVKAQLTNLQQSIQNDIDSIQKEDEDFTALAAASGPDATFDFTNFVDSSKVNLSPSDGGNARKQLRRQLNYLTRRLSYNVRANEDKNLFIVDDFYDKDYDILAYEQSLTDGIQLYNNDFTSTREKIINAAGLLNLEVFADTQGHIRVRSPQYNRMPSSVFYRMMYLKQAYGIQIFPQFLSDFFVNQIDTLRKRIEILEDLVRLDCAILNHTSDEDATNFILSSDATNTTGASFNFVSDTTGAVTDVNQLMIYASNDLFTDNGSQVQDLISLLEGQAKATKSVFNNSQRYSEIVKQLEAQKSNQQGYSVQDIFTPTNNTYIQQLISRIQTKSGQRIDKRDYIANNSDGLKDVVLPLGETIDVFKVTKELQDKLQERQKVIKLFYSTIKNAMEFKSLDNDQNPSVNNQLIAPGVFNNSNIPEVYEHMIEDESYDDYGPGSGSRFIIKNSQIRNLQFSPSPPDFTMVEIQGVLNPFAPNALPEGLNSFPGNGNGLVTAIAIDYDSWRNYGFKDTPPIRVPFLSDPNSQCAPYASMILSRNRKNILKATVTISGNEYMQPGEVVYLQDRQLLFYVNSVRHNFAFGSSFTTSLELTYGHSPGEYIPTTLDVIGKMIYNSRDIAGYTIQRQTNSGNENNLGVVIKTSEDILSNTFNNQTINNILYIAAYTINSNKSKGNNVTAKVELRLYFDDTTAVNSDLSTFATSVKDILTGQSDNPNNQIKSPTFSSENIDVSFVNLNNESDRRSPSQKAIDAARNQSNSVASVDNASNLSSDKIREVLFSYIVDCWLIFEQSSEF